MNKQGLILVAILSPLACVGAHVVAGMIGQRAMGVDLLLVAIIFAVYSYAQDEGALQNTVLAFLGHLVVLALILSIWTPMRQLLPVLAVVTGAAAFVGFVLGRVGRGLFGGSSR